MNETVLRLDVVNSSNHGDLAAVICATSLNWHPTVREVAQQWSTEPSHVQGIHLLAYEDGVVVGYGGVANSRHELVPGRFHLQVRVLPGCRHRGIGREIASHLDAWLRDRSPEALVGQTDGQYEGESFARARGFVQLEQRHEQRLSPSAFDASPGAAACLAATHRCGAEGIRITTLEALRASGVADPERRLYELDTEVMADEPTALAGHQVIFEAWVEEFLSGRDPNGVLVAMRADELVGLTVHWTESAAILIATTGVSARWRGHGIAKALKLASVEHARRVGLPLRTMNNAANEPILQLNRLCGFERVATFTRWQRSPAFPASTLK